MIRIFFLTLLAVSFAGGFYAEAEEVKIVINKSESDQAKLKVSVKESLYTTIKNNFDIKIQKSRPEIASKDVGIAESEFDLTIFGEASRTFSKTPSTSAFASPNVSEDTIDLYSVGIKQKLQPGTSYELSFETTKTLTNSIYAGVNPEYLNSVTLAMSQPLLKGMGWDVNTTNVFVAKTNRKKSRHAFRMEVMKLLTDAKTVYWTLVFLRKELDVQKKSLERAKDFLKRIELQVEVGVMAPIEIIAAQAMVAVREEALIGIYEQIGNTEDKLKAFMNLSSALPGSAVAIVPTDEPFFNPQPLNIDNLRDTAYENRPDYKQAILDVESRDRQSTYYSNQVLPKVDLAGSVTFKGVRGPGRTFTSLSGGSSTSSFAGGYGDSLNDLGRGKYYDYSVGIVAEIPLFNRQAKNQSSRAELELDIARQTLRKVKQQVEVDILRSIRAVDTAVKRVKATRASSLLAEKKYDAEVQKFEVGSSTSFTVLEYQKDLAAEKSKEMKALTDHAIALANLDLATGTVLTQNNITLEFAPE